MNKQKPESKENVISFLLGYGSGSCSCSGNGSSSVALKCCTNNAAKLNESRERAGWVAWRSVRVEDVGDFGRAINMKVSCLARPPLPPPSAQPSSTTSPVPCRRQPVKYSNSRNWNEAPWRQINWKYFTFSASTARQSMCRSIYPFLSVPLRSFCLIIQLRFRKIFVCCLTRFDFDSVSQNVDLQPQNSWDCAPLCSACESWQSSWSNSQEGAQPSPNSGLAMHLQVSGPVTAAASNLSEASSVVSQRIFGQTQIYWLIGILGISFKLRFARLGLVVLFFFGPGQGVRWGLGFNACCVRDPPRQRNNDDDAPRHVQPIFPSPENTKLK